MLAWIVLFGAVFALVVAVGQAFARAPNAKNLLLGALWLMIATWQGSAAAFELDSRPGTYDNAALVAGTLAYALTGPLYYLFLFRFTILDSPLRKTDLVLLSPCAIAAAAFIIPCILDPEAITRPDFTGMYATLFAGYISSLSTIACLALTFIRLLRDAPRFRKASTISLARFLRWMTLVALALAILELLTLDIAVNAAASGLLIAMFWGGNRFPGILQPEGPTYAGKQTRYERSRVAGLDQDEIVRRLDELMRRQRLYTNPELRLRDVATPLGVSEYQLSEILNARIGLNFHRYLSRHRVEAARRMLREQPERSTLTIGLEVGFNSNSVFYAAFLREVGEAPGRYRKRLRKQSPPNAN